MVIMCDLILHEHLRLYVNVFKDFLIAWHMVRPPT